MPLYLFWCFVLDTFHILCRFFRLSLSLSLSLSLYPCFPEQYSSEVFIIWQLGVRFASYWGALLVCMQFIELEIVFFVCVGSLKNYFSTFGEVKKCYLKRCQADNNSRYVKRGRGFEHATLWNRLDKILLVHCQRVRLRNIPRSGCGAEGTRPRRARLRWQRGTHDRCDQFAGCAVILSWAGRRQTVAWSP